MVYSIGISIERHDVTPAARGASTLLATLVLLLAATAQAGNGVLEINQACAVQTGCFSGDGAGYPVTIDGSAGRSYMLTGDLVLPDEITDGISVSTPSITIDLNGFEIVRSGCEGATADCKPAAGSGTGVERQTSGLNGITLKNGIITGMGGYGVLLGNQAEVKNVRVRWARWTGILVGNGSIVSGNTVLGCGLIGISASWASTVIHNTAGENGSDGVSAGIGSTVSGNTVYSNTSEGIVVGNGSTVSGNTAYFNGTDGIWANTGSTVSGNTSYDNEDDGIFAGTGSTVQRNTVRLNTGYGLNLSAGAAYRENTISGNTAGTVSGGLNMFSNSCNGTTTCP